MTIAPSKWKQLVLCLGLFLAFYVTSFVVVVLHGYEPGWNSPPSIGFRYSWNEGRNAAMYYFYLPLYKAAQPIVPLVALSIPIMPPEEREKYDHKW